MSKTCLGYPEGERAFLEDEIVPEGVRILVKRVTALIAFQEGLAKVNIRETGTLFLNFEERLL